MGKPKGKAKKAATSSSNTSSTSGATAGKGKASEEKKGKGSGGSLFYGDPLEKELASVGLRVNKITADGNCLFRAVGDQLEGDEGKHVELRQRACQLMVERREEFEPFVEDDQGFDPYVKRMRKDGVWGGHMELQALSLLTGCNVYVYQEGQPRWTVRNHPDTAPSIHISYHGGEHYNSVRLLDDYSRGPPKQIVLGDGGSTAAQIAKENATWTAADESRVATNTGCDNMALVQRVLKETCGDVDAAIEKVIEIMAGEEGEEVAAGTAAATATAAAATAEAAAAATAAAAAAEGGEVLSGTDIGESQAAASGQSQQYDQDVSAAAGGSDDSSRQPAVISIGVEPSSRARCEPASSGGAADGAAADGVGPCHTREQQSSSGEAGAASAHDSGSKGSKAKSRKGVAVGPSSSSATALKRPSRNKTCPCGSGKKWKACCGVAAAAAERRQKALKEAAAASDGTALPTMLATLTI